MAFANFKGLQYQRLQAKHGPASSSSAGAMARLSEISRSLTMCKRNKTNRLNTVIRTDAVVTRERRHARVGATHCCVLLHTKQSRNKDSQPRRCTMTKAPSPRYVEEQPERTLLSKVSCAGNRKVGASHTQPPALASKQNPEKHHPGRAESLQEQTSRA